MACFRAWEDWAIYSSEYLINLQNLFLGLVASKDHEQSSVSMLCPAVGSFLTLLSSSVINHMLICFHRFIVYFCTIFIDVIMKF